MPDVAALPLETGIGYGLGDAIIESIADGVIVLDSNGRIVRVNAALYNILEISSDEIPIPCDCRDSSFPMRLQNIVGVFKGYVVGEYETLVSLPSGNRSVFRVIPLQINTPNGVSAYIVRNVTDEHESQRIRSLFLSQVAHELRAPLQHILGFSSLISDLDDLERQDYVRFVEHIQSETEHLTRLVNDLVEFSRMETGRFSVYLEPVRLDELIADIVNKLGSRARVLELTLSAQEINEPLWITSDSLRLEQVLSNLVENAFKFVSPGGRIHISLDRDQAHIAIHVSDTGSGIPPEELTAVFDSYHQVRQGNKRRNVGLGLGLYISRQIVQALGGDIWVESQLGVGSTFSFTLPYKAP
mgnify:FL=1